MAVKSPELTGSSFVPWNSPMADRPKPSSFQLAAESFRASNGSIEPSAEFYEASAQERIQKQIATTGLTESELAQARGQEAQTRVSEVQKATGNPNWVELYRQRKARQSEAAKQQATVYARQQELHTQTQELRSELVVESFPKKIRRLLEKLRRYA